MEAQLVMRMVNIVLVLVVRMVCLELVELIFWQVSYLNLDGGLLIVYAEHYLGNGICSSDGRCYDAGVSSNLTDLVRQCRVSGGGSVNVFTMHELDVSLKTGLGNAPSHRYAGSHTQGALGTVSIGTIGQGIYVAY